MKKANRADLLFTSQQQKQNEKEKQREEELVFFLCMNEKGERGNEPVPGGRLVQVVPLCRMEGEMKEGGEVKGGRGGLCQQSC